MKTDDELEYSRASGPDHEGLPPRPVAPDPQDCCGGGCVPCIFDRYEQALEKWQREVARLQARQHAQKKSS